MATVKKESTKSNRPSTFKEWFEKTMPEGRSKDAYIAQLVEKSGHAVSRSTIWNTLKGQRLTSYAKAKAISDLTGGKVKFTEIIDI